MNEKILGSIDIDGIIHNHKGSSIGKLSTWVAEIDIYDTKKQYIGTLDISGNIYKEEKKVGHIDSISNQWVHSDQKVHYFTFDMRKRLFGIAIYGNNVHDLSSGNIKGVVRHGEIVPINSYLGYVGTHFVTGTPIYDSNENFLGVFDYSSYMWKSNGSMTGFVNHQEQACLFTGMPIGSFHTGIRGKIAFRDGYPIGALDTNQQLRDDEGQIIGMLGENETIKNKSGTIIGSLRKKLELDQRIELSGARSNIGAQAHRMIDEWNKTSRQQSVNSAARIEKEKNLPPITQTLETMTIKTGDMLYARLITAINTDVPGPVLAKIISGPLRDATIIGNITSRENQVYIQFNTINFPNQPHTFSIKAVAVDSYNLQTALASKVDRHFLQRYISLAVASFASGYAKAATASDTVYVIEGGQLVVKRKNDQNKIYATIGELGDRLGGEIGKNFHRSNTIHVYAGTPIGLLFTTDVSLPTRGT